MFLNALVGEFLHHFCLGSNRGVVGTWNPTCVFALHASSANKNILNGVVEHVTHVEHTRDIWWWDDYGIRFSAVRLRTEKFVVNPILIPLRLYFFRVILCCQFHAYSMCLE